MGRLTAFCVIIEKKRIKKRTYSVGWDAAVTQNFARTSTVRSSFRDKSIAVLESVRAQTHAGKTRVHVFVSYSTLVNNTVERKPHINWSMVTC